MIDPTVRYEVRTDGYCRIRVWCPIEQRDRYVYEHQLVALADGADPAKIFSDGAHHVHHCNGHRINNRPSNIEVRSREEHGRLTTGSTVREVEAFD